MIYRKQIRTIKNSTETTLETSSIESSALAFNLSTSDAFYIGFHKPFTTRYFYLATASSASSTVSVSYWNGTAYAPVEDKVDTTLGFTQSGFIGWQNPGDWKDSFQSPVTDLKLYWVKITVSVNLSAPTSLQAVLNLFCDQTLLRTYYPELVTDERYLPANRTTFIEQFEAAKDRVVLRLKQMHAIADESEIIDINEVAIAATHATANIILQPLTRSGDQDTRAADAEKQFNQELDRARQSFDLDNDGVIEPAEEDRRPTFYPRR